jgi:outer membrane protein assembly factor BamA
VRGALGLVLGLVAAHPAPAQVPDVPLPGPGWTDVAYPKLYYSRRDGLTVGAYYALISPLGYKDYDRPPAYRASFSINGQISTSSSREIALEARLPDLFPGWRLVGTFNAQRLARENYFGIGNGASIDDAKVSDAQPNFYRSVNLRYAARGEVQRRVVGPLRLLAGFHAERWRIDTLPGASQLAADLVAGAANDVSARAGLVFDARDNEVAPRAGGLIEAIYSTADSTVAGDLSYTRTTVSAAGYLPVGPQIVVAARVVGEAMGGAPRLGSFYRVEASDRTYDAIGGPSSNRALEEHRLLGRNKLLANLDVRYDAYAVPTLVRTTVLAFLDAGRVFEPEPFKLTTAGMKVGGGGGLIIQFGRAGILGTPLGVGPDGMVLQFHTRWSY